MKGSALVLGGGFAGLSAAIHLALKGLEVSLIEQNDRLGGKALEVAFEGFRFDTGPSVVTLAPSFEDIFTLAQKPVPIAFKPLDLLCHYRFSSGRQWNVFQDMDKTLAQLDKEEARVYKELLLEAKKLFEASSPTFIYGQAPGLRALFSYALRHGLAAHPFKRLPQLLDAFGAKGDVKDFFLRYATYFGANPYKAPAVLHNIAWAELGLGVRYPLKGIYAMVEALADLASTLGVNVYCDTKVEALEHKHGKLSQVHSSKGSFKADVVVSSLDIVRTHELLGLATKLKKKEASLSGFVLLLAVESQSDLHHHNISFSHNYEAEWKRLQQGFAAQDPTLYIHISSKTQANDAPKGCENWFVMANVPAHQEENPLDESAYAQHICEVLEHRGLLARGQIRHQKILGPSYLVQLSHRGSIYGHAPHSLTAALRPHQSLKAFNNLILAGGSVYPGGGIPLSLLSGKAAAELAVQRHK